MDIRQTCTLVLSCTAGYILSTGLERTHIDPCEVGAPASSSGVTEAMRAKASHGMGHGVGEGKRQTSAHVQEVRPLETTDDAVFSVELLVVVTNPRHRQGDRSPLSRRRILPCYCSINITGVQSPATEQCNRQHPL
jgi:hypothetical protein